ncbi:hypothetical protein J3D54_005540 [Pseudomonas sp. GGS8]|uniref:hypothetical protein n=1 Tax=Pseudomonas sp. GGS8 TaxID=2817892 RepID=UPI00209F5E11|nr:hypothetical protein [Pseudomonas sp. GGS8]MCP1446408.1 hypothetical protein [Pseudomonas sp. GGS8]
MNWWLIAGIGENQPIISKESKMSETILNAMKSAADADYTAEQQRAHAVAAALEVISTRVGNDNTSLAREISSLSTYADQIQEALKIKAE